MREFSPMTKRGANGSRANGPAVPETNANNGDDGPRRTLRGLDSNPQGAFGPKFWQAFRGAVAHIFDSVSLPDPSEEARFTLSTRTYATPRGILMRSQGTAFIKTRGPASAARSANQLVIV